MKVARESSVFVKNEWDVIVARQQGRQLAHQIGFTIVDQTRITTVISELARNIYLYTSGGEIYLAHLIRPDHSEGIQVKAIDLGPGIKDITLALQDGYTTVDGLGIGLPGVKRMVDEFDIRSDKQRGTQVCVKKWLVTEDD